MKKNSVTNPENFQARVNYATHCILKGGNKTRKFDTCFEMGDGEAVVTVLVRKANKKEAFNKALVAYLGNDESFNNWLATAEKHKDVTSHKMKLVAAEMRKNFIDTTKTVINDSDGQ